MKARLLGVALGAARAFAWWPGESLPAGAVADRVEVDKAARELRLLADGAVIKTSRVSFGAEPVGPKRREGDERTPEGLYAIDGRNPGSAFSRSIRVSDPDGCIAVTDREMAEIWRAVPVGTPIEIRP